MTKATQTIPRLSLAARLRRLDSEFLRPHRRSMLVALAGMFLGSRLLLLVSLVQGSVLDRLLEGIGHDSLPATNIILWMLAIVLACHVGRMLLVWRTQSIMNRVSLEVVRELTDALHRIFQRLPLSYFDGEQTGQLMARITSDVGSLMILLGNGSLQLASDLVLALGIVGVLIWLRWQLALVCFLIVPLYAVNHQLFATRFRSLSERLRLQIGALYALLSERISAVRIVRSFAREEAELARLDERIDAHRDLSRAGLWTGAWQSALAAFITGVGTVAVLVAGIFLIRAGRLTVGELLAFCALTAQLYNPIVRLVQFQGGAAATRVAIERMMEVLEAPELLRDHPQAEPLSAPRGRLVFENMSFRALLAQPQVLLLDDCTSALDAETELRVQAAIDDLLPGRTKFIVLHKAASLRHADWVVVLGGGRIVMQGREEDLFATDACFPQSNPLPLAAVAN